MKQDEAIIFDLDGTLTNTLNYSVDAAHAGIKEASCQDISREQILATFGRTETALFKMYCPTNWQQAADYYGNFFKETVTEQTLFPGIKQVLEYLKQNKIKTAIVTGRGPSAHIILERAGIKDYFDYVKTGSEEGSIKPRCIKEVIEAWGQDPKKTYYIGDIPHDIEDAKEAGVNALSASWFEDVDKEAQMEKQPKRIFHTVEDFLEWIKQN